MPDEKSTPEGVQVETEEGAQKHTHYSGVSAPPVDLAAQIDENNTDLTARIADAIKLTNSMAGITPCADPAPSVQQLESLFPHPNSVISSTQAMGTMAPMATASFSGQIAPTAFPGQEQSILSLLSSNSSSTQAPMATTPFSAQIAPTAPLPGQEQSILSLFSSNSNFLSASDMAVPVNDPSLFLPTPFAPGQNANTLQQQVSTPHSFALIAPIAGVFPSASIPAAMPPLAAIPSAATQQALFQQLAAAYAMGGQQPLFVPATVPGGSIPPALMNGLLQQSNLMGGVGPTMAGGLIPPAFMNGLLQQNNLMGGVGPAMAGGLIPPALMNGLLQQNNPMGGVGLNMFAAGIPASLNPGMAGLPGIGPLANMGNLTTHNMAGNLMTQPTANGSSIASSTLNQVASLNNDLAMLPQQSAVQEQIDRMNAASLADVNLPRNTASSQQNPNSLKRQTASSSGKIDPLVKSREARWVIRYNELLEFRREHGHCRVPHGYTSNRKLSWWVMNQRAQFAHRKQGKKTWLTDDRIQLLNDLGFIWSPHLKRTSGGGKKKEKSESGARGKKKEKVESSGASNGGGKKRENPESSEAGGEGKKKEKKKGGDSKADGKKKKKK
eukprot:CAMPEP_0172302518 /NCGR_PEP_ID=MMETSP1058-20130122/4216_1 /TAXON_ID=83371 /ORGANISM="Detonula confervacea, Strain CCMP 353" /LENGTH=610 /DNA_ID=CAMNT_0013013033 /DNA_START=44 /DNA_END=1876 /DNA_ORIENTATION=+